MDGRAARAGAHHRAGTEDQVAAAGRAQAAQPRRPPLRRRKKMKLTMIALAALLAAPAWSHDNAHSNGKPEAVVKEQKPWGIAGDAKGARTITIRMSDDMRFHPERIEVREG